ncbi:MAG: DUF721 domain-containing protein [Pseudomonadota bacterium]
MQKPFRTKAARRAPPKLARAGADLVARLAKQTKFVDPSLAEHWQTIVGAEVANLCRPGRITGHRGARALEVYVTSGAKASELHYQLEDMKSRLNAYLGPNAVSRIVVKQLARRQKSGGADEDGSAALEKALASFRRSVGVKTE